MNTKYYQLDESYRARLAKPQDVAEVYKLMLKVAATCPEGTFVCDDLEFVEKHVEEEGFILMAETEDGTFGSMLIVGYPMEYEGNMGKDAGFTGDELLKVVQLESCVTDISHRGHHLERKLFRLAEELIDKSRFSYLMSTVSPENPASYKSMEAIGMRCIREGRKYGDLIRRTYIKEIQ